MILSKKGNIIPTLIYEAQIEWWKNSNELPEYFWIHYLFEVLCNCNHEFRQEWKKRFIYRSMEEIVLVNLLNFKYDKMNFEAIKQLFVQKLTYKILFDELATNASFFHYIISVK